MIELKSESKTEIDINPALTAAFENLESIREGLELQLAVSHALIAADSDLEPAKRLLLELSAAEAPDQAIELCLKLVDQHTFDQEIALSLGNFFAESNDFLRAEQAYRIGLQLAPNDTRILSSLSSVISHDDGRLDEALTLSRQSIEAHPSSAVSHYLFGRVLEKDGDEQQASEHFSIAAEIDPENQLFAQAARHYECD